MFFYIAFILLIIIALGDSVVKYFYKQREFDLNIKKKNTNVKLNKLTITLLYITFLLLIAVCFSPYIFTRKAEWAWADLSQKGDLGDAIGGMTSPFIGVASVIITGLAFYMQYTANKLQVDLFKQQNEETKKQFNEQLKLSNEQFDQQIKNQVNEINRLQFESQFYERIKFLKEEINSLSITTQDDKLLTGRQVFYELNKEINFTYLIINYTLPYCDSKLKFELAYYIFYYGRNFVFKSKEIQDTFPSIDSKKWFKLDKLFKNNYELFKSNDHFNISQESDDLIPKPIHINDDVLEVFKSLIDMENLNEDSRDKLLNYYTRNSEDFVFKYLLKTEKMKYIYYKSYINVYNTKIKHLPFQGMYSKLSIIYRQIFTLVKFVTTNSELSYNEKRNYLRILRSILGNYEQLHLFYNWYGGISTEWENSDNKFFSDYRMIHNLPISFLNKEINIHSLFDSKFMYEEGKKDYDSLFELSGWYSK